MSTVPRPVASPWSMDVDGLESVLETSFVNGLPGSEAVGRLEEWGPNEIESASQTTVLQIALRQFKSPLIYLLMVAAVISAALQEFIDAGVISTVLAFNAVVGFIQEHRAERSIESLQRLARSMATVIRDGCERTLDALELVPGDLIRLDQGQRVPADARVVVSQSLAVDESVLTGESTTVGKQTDRVDAAAPLAERTNMVFSGTVITRGKGRAVVTATGGSSALGSIAGSLSALKPSRTPLQQRMDRLANVIGLATLMLGSLLFGFGAAAGRDLEELFFTLISLAVSAIPEGLPIVLTVALAVGVNRMAKRNAVIRHLPAVETLGSCTVIGSDKTGTLTQNKMTVRICVDGTDTFEVSGPGDRIEGEVTLDGSTVSLENHPVLSLLLRAGVLANDATIESIADGRVEARGDPTEVALLVAAAKAGIDLRELELSWRSFAEVPFSSESKFAASFRQRGAESFVFVKGAPEEVLSRCKDALETEFNRDALLAQGEELANQGLRVLAFAYSRVVAGVEPGPDALRRLTFLGLAGMIDPPRTEVAEAVHHCRKAGIRVLMITGDHRSTAAAIARELGIANESDGITEGIEIDELDDDALAEVVRRTSVFARAAPEHKLRIVLALQSLGEVVAVTGDGVNDAPALKAADIGVAMGATGTDVAKEAAEMVITDDNFASIYAGVEEGRYSFANVRKATFYLLASAVAEVVAVISAIVVGFPVPFLPAQILWLNVVTNGVQDVALALEGGEEELMTQRPRARSEGVISGLILERTLIVGAWMGICTLLIFLLHHESGTPVEDSRSIALTAMVMFQVVLAYNARSEFRSIMGMRLLSNRFLLIGTIVAVSLHLAALYTVAGNVILRLEGLSAVAWLEIAALAGTVTAVMELHKRFRGSGSHNLV